MNEKIKDFLKRNEIRRFNSMALFSRMRLPKKEKAAYFLALKKLEAEGLLKRKSGNYVVINTSKKIEAVIDRMNGTFAFAKTNEGEEYFIPGSYLHGAITGDKVLLEPLRGEGEHDSAAVRKILEYGDRLFSGEVRAAGKRAVVFCHEFGKFPVLLSKSSGAREGDKVLFSVTSRKGKDVYGRVEENFGGDTSAAICAEMYLLEHEIPTEFSKQALEESEILAEEGICAEGRIDLRSEKIFTIDSASSKDLDDAVSLEETERGYALKVSIADVSHYIKKGSALDNEAYDRGTSIYYADKVIPMLPKVISNGICSLSEGEDRYTFTCEAEISKNGEILGYRFYKSMICSAVKGVYSEINELLGGTASLEVEKKYAAVKPQLLLMERLYHVLAKRRVERNVVDFETAESYFLLDENGKVSGVAPRERGISECIIEEFMILANRCAGMFARENELPFIYRVHEAPNPEKTGELRQTLHLLGIPVPPEVDLNTGAGLKAVFDIVHGKEFAPIIEMQMLRSMAKARYDEKNCGHFGLSLDIYSHFTSPIRRYSDLAIHRIMSDCLNKGAERAKKKHFLFAADAADRSSLTERRAVAAERDIDDKYRAEFASRHIGEEAEGIISGVTNNGFFVLLPNTVEGFVSVSEMGRMKLIDGIMLESADKARRFRIGDKVRIAIAGADIFAGKTDFILAE